MTLETLLTHPAVQALGRALLHFLWQGALMALLVWLIQRIAPPSAARLRYAAATLVMMAMPVALILTVGLGSRSAPAAPIPSVRRAIPLLPPASVLYTPSLPAPPPGISGWVVCGWLAGVFLLSIRASIGWVRAQRLKRHAQPASQELEQAFANLLRQLRISAPIRLCTSALVHVPAVIGWLRPYILLPVTALTGLSESQLRAILAHELAHIRRHDYLVNLLQTAIETALFYHPAVWWVGQQMRIEREHCCDDIAVAICGDAIEYAAALTELEEIRGRIPEPALAATGGNLLSRVRRLLGEPDRPSRSFGAIAAAALVVLISASAVVSLDAQPPQNKPPAEKKEGVAKSEKAANAKATTVVTVSETRELSSLIRDASPAKLDVDREIGKVQLALAQLGAGKPEQQVTSQGADLLLKLFDSAQERRDQDGRARIPRRIEQSEGI